MSVHVWVWLGCESRCGDSTWTGDCQPKVGHCFLFSICTSIKTQWLLHCILLTQLRAYLTSWDTHEHIHACTPLTRLSPGSWCSASWSSPATLEKDRDGKTRVRGWRPLAYGDIFVFSCELLKKSLNLLQDTVCFLSHVFYFSMYFSPSSLLHSNNLTTPTGYRKLSSPPAASHILLSMRLTSSMAAQRFKNKWLCLAEMYHSASFTLTS